MPLPPLEGMDYCPNANEPSDHIMIGYATHAFPTTEHCTQRCPRPPRGSHRALVDGWRSMACMAQGVADSRIGQQGGQEEWWFPFGVAWALAVVVAAAAEYRHSPPQRTASFVRLRRCRCTAVDVDVGSFFWYGFKGNLNVRSGTFNSTPPEFCKSCNEYTTRWF